MNPREEPIRVGDEVRTAIALPGIPAGTRGVVKEIGRPFIVVTLADGRHGYYSRQQLRPVESVAEIQVSCGSRLVPLGLDELHIPRDSHTCLLASSNSIAIGVSARYVAAGLGNGETLMCFLPPRARAGLIRSLSELDIEADASIDRGQLTIATPANIYMPASQFDPVKQLRAVASFASEATREAQGGLRCCGFVGVMYKAKGWWQYEQGITQILRDHGFTAMCVYDGSARRAGIMDKLYETHTHVLRDWTVTQGRVAS